jgi:type VI secretion system protein VasG
VLDSAVEAAVELSDRYISGRQLPDKGVDVLDTACARVSIGQSAKPGALDDLERRLANLDIAIQAIGKDQETALVDRGEELAALQARREAIEVKRAELHARWTRELEQVEAIRQLQLELERAKRAAAAGDAAAEADAQPAAAPAEGAEELPPPRDPAVLREEILKAVRTLEEMQGEAPLVQLHVDEATVAQVVGDWTGIPVGNMLRDEVQSILTLEDKLRERVVGQDHAMTAIAKKIRAAKTGLQSPTQPIGVFLLVGPSGVGKTETGLAIADQLFGGERFMVTINMSEFMEKHSVSRLIGSPPGYVGYGEGGVLTEAVRHRPYSVVLLDEVEKADPEVMNLFYQVFDKGTLSDGEGRIVDFKNTVVLMTSNLASDVIMQACQGDEPPGVEQLVEMVRPSLQKHFKPALLGRMSVIPYFALGQEVLRLITHLKLGKVERRLAESHGITFEVTPEARDALVARCTDPESGARDLDHVIDQAILPRISQRLLEQMAEDELPTRLTLGAADGEFTFAFSND